MPESPEVVAEADHPDYTFETFVASGSSVAAVTACVAASDGGTANPLFLFGPVGSGKTHLLHATARSLRARRPHANIRRLRAKEYVAELLTGVRANEAERFRETFWTLDALLLDDVHVTGAMPATEEEIFRCLADMISAGVQLVITCTDQSRETVQHHVLARSFDRAAAFDLTYPDLAAGAEILRRLTAARGLPPLLRMDQHHRHAMRRQPAQTAKRRRAVRGGACPRVARALIDSPHLDSLTPGGRLSRRCATEL